jgi:TPR repeat protein
MKLRALLALLTLAAGSALAADAGADFARAAQLHRNGETAAAMRIWQQWADRGDADGAYNLGLVLQHGDGTARDPARALHWYKLAAERGDKAAAAQAGLMLLNGDGVPADETEAHRWFTLPRQHHAHHAHQPQMLAWQRQAAEMIRERDLRESLAASSPEQSARIVAELRQRAGLPPVAATRLAAR